MQEILRQLLNMKTMKIFLHSLKFLYIQTEWRNASLVTHLGALIKLREAFCVCRRV